MKKRLSLLMALMMVLSLVPMSVFAAGTPFTSVATIDNQTTGSFNVTFELPQYEGLNAGKLRLELENADFAGMVTAITPAGTTTANANGGIVFIDMNEVAAPADPTKITLNLRGNVDFEDSAKGDVYLVVTDSSNLGIGSQKVKFAVVTEESSKDLSISVKEADKKLSVDGGKLSQFEIKNFGSFDAPETTKSVEIKLPEYFNFAETTKVYVDGTLAAPAISGRTITLSVGSTVKSVLVMPEITSVSNRASMGDIEVAVTTTTDDTTAIIGQLVDYAVTMKAVEPKKKDIPTFYGGYDATQKVEVTLSGVKGSFGTRPIDFKLTDAKITTARISSMSITGGTLDTSSVEPTSNSNSNLKNGEFTIIPTAMTDKIEFTLEIHADWDSNATAKLTATSREFEAATDLAVIVPIFTVETSAIDVKKGESTKTSDIVITEAEHGIIKRDIRLSVDSKRGVEFADDGTAVAATNGLKLKKSEFPSSTDATALIYPYNNANSTKNASVITLSGLHLAVAGSTVDSTVVVDVQIKDAAGNYKTVASVDYATVVKEYANEPTTTVFTIANAKYTVNGVEKTLLAAPYIKEGRTMLPVRALAESLGLTVDYNNGQAVFSSPTKTASHIIGTDVIYVNGTPIKMEVASELHHDTTFVELKSLAAAFGVSIEWDATAKTVTVQG